MSPGGNDNVACTPVAVTTTSFVTTPTSTEADHTTPTPWEGVRFQPSVALGLLVYAGYLAIFYATWKINNVDYDTIGKTVESTKLHYAMPTVLGCAFLIVAITVMLMPVTVPSSRQRALTLKPSGCERGT